MLEVGMRVNVLEPFTEFFPGAYVVDRIEVVEGSANVFLVDVEPAFDIKFLMEAPE